jgi:NTP pyrophosphatase (non-canonical NTP hydrolase)
MSPPTDPVESLESLREAVSRFAQERDWDRYHAPKNLAAALIVEAGELLEHFQWMSESESERMPPHEIAEVRLEMADVLLYLVRLADRLDVDLMAAARDKLALNAAKYPVAKAKGSRRKYDRL